MSCPGNVQIRNSCEQPRGRDQPGVARPVVGEKYVLGAFFKTKIYRYTFRRNLIVLCAMTDERRTKIRRSGNTLVDEWSSTKKGEKRVGKKAAVFRRGKSMEKRLNPACKSDKALHRTFDKRSIFPESVARQLCPDHRQQLLLFFPLSFFFFLSFAHPLCFAASTEREQRNAERAGDSWWRAKKRS